MDHTSHNSHTRPPSRDRNHLESKENAGKFDFLMTDLNSKTYYTTIILGSHKQEVKVAFDTMTPMSIINSQNCQECDDTGRGFEY